jgi:hypothetical protein
MADLHPEGDELVFHLRGAEKAEGFHGDIRVPLSAETAVRVVDDVAAAAASSIQDAVAKI